MTSSQLLNRTNVSEKVSYRIVGKAMSLPVDSSLCSSIEDADKHAIGEAVKYAKDFRCITLYKKIGNEKEVVIYKSRACKKDRINARLKNFFKPVPRVSSEVCFQN
jgi:hypothetical protein